MITFTALAQPTLFSPACAKAVPLVLQITRKVVAVINNIPMIIDLELLDLIIVEFLITKLFGFEFIRMFTIAYIKGLFVTSQNIELPIIIVTLSYLLYSLHSIHPDALP